MANQLWYPCINRDGDLGRDLLSYEKDQAHVSHFGDYYGEPVKIVENKLRLGTM